MLFLLNSNFIKGETKILNKKNSNFKINPFYAGKQASSRSVVPKPKTPKVTLYACVFPEIKLINITHIHKLVSQY